MWRATVLTLFPEMFPGPLAGSVTGKALAAGAWALETMDIRDFARNKHRSVDDTPFGGGAGMVLRPDVVDQALRAVVENDAPQADGRPLVFLSPRGTPFRQEQARAFAAAPGMVLLCGRYEGIDQRVIDAWSARGLIEVSLGDFVLSGGEVAAMAVLDACVRLLPGAIGNLDSAAEESFEAGLLEYPHYTRPQLWDDAGVRRAVPKVLLSGHHERIRAWRRAEAEALTRARRPDLWARHQDPRRAGGRAEESEG